MEHVWRIYPSGALYRAWSGKGMRGFFDDSGVQWVLWLGLLAMLTVVAIYVLEKIRAAPAQQEPEESEMISKFHELHSKGELTDAEFRTIKTTLAARLQEKVKDNGEKG